MIAQNIRFIRQRKGYSQEFMSMKLHISQNAYSKMERGCTELTVSRIYEIAEVLEVSVYDILPASLKSMPFFAGSVIWFEGMLGKMNYLVSRVFSFLPKNYHKQYQEKKR